MGNLVRDQRSERVPRLPGEINVEVDGSNTTSVGLRELGREMVRDLSKAVLQAHYGRVDP
jgi:hypothetical protein